MVHFYKKQPQTHSAVDREKLKPSQFDFYSIFQTQWHQHDKITLKQSLKTTVSVKQLKIRSCTHTHIQTHKKQNKILKNSYTATHTQVRNWLFISLRKQKF